MILRGDVLYFDFGERFGSEQSGLRPAVVVQNNAGNRHAPTVIVVPLTTKYKRDMPTHVTLFRGDCDNLQPSTALCEQVTVIDVSRALSYVGQLSESCMRRIDKALSVSLGLEVAS